jgi:hypothetical protein
MGGDRRAGRVRADFRGAPATAPVAFAGCGERWADRLRRVTVKAPLQSLFVAFILGIRVAGRR